MTTRPQPADPTRAIRRLALLVTLAGAGFAVAYGLTAYQGTSSNRAAAPVAVAPAPRDEQPDPDPDATKFEPTIENDRKPPGPAPAGMVWIPGGEFSMGCEDPRPCPCGGPDPMPDARPIHRVYVDGFWMDQTEVTNEQFAEFVAATSYVTIVEKTPRIEDFPTVDVPAELLVAGSAVFRPTPGPVPLNNYRVWWQYVEGACWRHPQGPDSNIDGKEEYPVVQIAHQDAVAYCKWAGKRLPTEAEWEFAARAGMAGKRYAWGDELQPGEKWMANIYQGQFPVEGGDTGADGFAGIAPVAQYTANRYGLFDVAGNVWEWCADWYRHDYYAFLAANSRMARNPQGPTEPYDPAEPNIRKRVRRGGSYLCTDKYCTRYMVGTRGNGEATFASDHGGFRCVMSPSVAR